MVVFRLVDLMNSNVSDAEVVPYLLNELDAENLTFVPCIKQKGIGNGDLNVLNKRCNY